MASLLDILKKGREAVKDAFTFTEEEKTSGKKPSILERIPMRTAEARDNIEGFFAPSPNEVRVRDFVRELPQATKDVAKEIAQGTARSFDFVGRKGLDAIFGSAGPSAQLDRSQSTKLEDILFGGRNKRVDTLAERGQVELGLDPEKSPILAPVVGFGLTALDLFPGGQGKGKAGSKLLKAFGNDTIEFFAKTTDRDAIESVIKEKVKDIDDVVAKELAEEIAGQNTKKGVQNIIKKTDLKAQETEPLYTTNEETKKRGLKMLTKAFGDKESAIEHAKQFWAKEGTPGLFYHATAESSPFNLFDKSKAKNMDADLRSGVSNVNGLYVSRDAKAINEFYNLAAERGKNIITFKGNPKLLDLTDEDTMQKFVKKFNTGDKIEKELARLGYDGIKYFDPYATGEEIVITNFDAVKPVAFNGKKIKTNPTSKSDLSNNIDPKEYKTAEKYIKAHGTPVYRGDAIKTDRIKDGVIKGKAEFGTAPFVSFADNKNLADRFGDVTKEYYIGDKKILDILNSKDKRAVKIIGRNADPDIEVVKKLKELGYDGIKIPHQEPADAGVTGNEIRLFGDYKIKTRSQLIEEWEKAHSSSETIKKQIVDQIPKSNKTKVEKALEEAEKETKKLSPRRIKDAKKYGISEDVMGRMLYAKAGGRMSHVEASNLAQKIKAPIKDLLQKDANTFSLNRPKIEAYSQELQGYFEKVVKTLKAQAEAHPDDSILQQQYAKASRIYMQARITLEAVITEAGRVVEGAKVIGKYSRIPGMDGKIKQVRDRIVEFAKRNPKYEHLPTEFDMALETVDMNNATQLLDFLTQWNQASFLQKLSEFQKASLLSALSTHAVNALGNAIQQLLDVPVRALAGGLDAVRAGITKTPREVYAGESLAQIRGAFRSAPSALEQAWEALKNEHFAQELRRTEIEAGTPVPAIKGRFGKVVRLPFRLLQMADLGFRTLKKGAESEALAVRIAKMEGLKGKAYKDRVKELSKKLPEDMLDFVDERTERALMLEELSGLLKSVESLKNQYPIMQFVIPFYRTLVNLSREAYRMTPIGGIGRTVGKIIPGQMGQNITEAFSNTWTKNKATRMEELSRQIIGTGIMAWVVTHMLNGDIEITGPAPEKEGDRELFYAQGKIPHAIRWGDTWVQFQRVQPIGQLLQIGASISEAIEAYKNTGELDSEQVEKEMFNAISDIWSMVFTQSPFTGMADLFDLLKGGEYNEGYLQAGNKYIGQMIGTFIPNILRRLTVAGDPIIYEKRDIPSQLQSRVPGLQKNLTPRRDIFGEIVRQDGTFLSRFASPIKTSQSIENALYDEMASIQYTPIVPDREAFNEKLSVKEYETLLKYYGPRLRDELWLVINDDAYKSLNDEQKRDVIENISRKTLNMARQKLFPIYAEKNELRQKWKQEGYTPLVIEDALKTKYPYEKETLELYAEAILQQSIQRGDARPTIENILKNQ